MEPTKQCLMCGATVVIDAERCLSCGEPFPQTGPVLPPAKLTIAGIFTYAVLGFIAPIVLFGGAVVLRLYSTGFPPLDVQHDVERFPQVVIPIAITSSIDFGLAGLAINAVPQFSRLRVIVYVIAGSVIAVVLYNSFPTTGLGWDEFWMRCASAAIGAGIVCLAIRISARRLFDRSRSKLN